MKENKIELYCTGCRKNYTVKKEDLGLMVPLYHYAILYENGRYIFEGGCFFKLLAKLKREEKMIS